MDQSEFRYKIEDLEAKYLGANVTIVGNGETGIIYEPQPGERVWVINAGLLHTTEAELMFVMDDLEGPAWDAHRQKEQWMDILKNGLPMEDGTRKYLPIITTRRIAGFPATVEYPLKRVLGRFRNFGYFAETLSYMVAWATMIGVKRLAFHGCDFWSQDRRNQRATAEHWIGRYLESGGAVMVNPGSALLSLPPRDGVNRHIDGFYGYTHDYFPLQILIEGERADPPIDARPDQTAVRAAGASQVEQRIKDLEAARVVISAGGE